MTDHLGKLLGVNPISLGLAATGWAGPSLERTGLQGLSSRGQYALRVRTQGGSGEVGKEPVLQGNWSQPRDPG